MQKTNADEWPLKEEHITTKVCQRCALCCEMELKPYFRDERMMSALSVMVEEHDNIKWTGSGIRIRCSHLINLKSDGSLKGCKIYNDRPKLCKDFNCVSWARVSNNRDQYNEVLKKLQTNKMWLAEYDKAINP